MGDSLLRDVFRKDKSSPHFGLLFSLIQGYALMLVKNGLGHSLGDVFTNSSGHTGSRKKYRLETFFQTSFQSEPPFLQQSAEPKVEMKQNRLE
jgi:hypothetical protein